MFIEERQEPVSLEKIQGVKRSLTALSVIEENLQHKRERLCEKVDKKGGEVVIEGASFLSLSPSLPLIDRAIKFLKSGDRLMAFNFSKESKILVVSVCKTPYAQTSRVSYLAPSLRGEFLSGLPLPFSEWSLKQQVDGAKSLKQLGAPVSVTIIKKIYAILKNFLTELCHDGSIQYPALYNLCAFEQDENSSEVDQERHLTLEISSDRKASLLFFQDKETFISKGGAKSVWKGFSLDSLQKKAYGISKGCCSSSHFNREEKFLIELKDSPFVVNVDRISYYHQPKRESIWQWIEMKFYRQTLSSALDSKHRLRTRNSDMCTGVLLATIDYSIRFMEGITYLHSRGIIHRDIKPSNVLVDRGELALTDFGISCEGSDQEALNERKGSFLYFSPERWVKYFAIHDSELMNSPLGAPMDIWSAGCVLWYLLKQGAHPWLGDVPTCMSEAEFGVSKKSILSILEQMREFDSQQPEEGGVNFLLWKMLRYRPEDRWTAQEVLSQLESLKLWLNS